MRVAKPEWKDALRRLEGCADADIRFNETVHRWEFVFAGADGIPRSQFFGWFNRPIEPQTGLYPFRELTDEGMAEALRNLERTYIANRHDGPGNTRRSVMQRYRFNRDLQQRKYREAGEVFADMAVERGKRLRGALQIVVPTYIGGPKA